MARFATSLQRKHSDELGFLPTIALRQYAERGQITPTTDNDEPIGYVLYLNGRQGNKPANHPDRVKLHQGYVQYDARGIYHGTSLIREVEHRARMNGFASITAWVASDILTNEFWKAIGYTIIGEREGGKRRNRIHNLWAKELEIIRPPDPRPPNRQL